MKRIITLALTLALATVPVLGLTACGGNWETLTSGGIAIESVERDENGYIDEDDVLMAAFNMAEVMEPEVMSYETELDTSSDPVTWTVNFDADGTTYHYVVNAENGDLIDFSSISLGF